MINSIVLMQDSHEGQMYGDMEYWLHPLEVMHTGKILFENNWNEVCSYGAIFHDSIEDTTCLISDIATTVESDSRSVRTAAKALMLVDEMTRPQGVTYEDYIADIIKNGMIETAMVKYADNYVNFTGDKSHMSDERKEKLQNRYSQSIVKLGIHLNKNGIVPLA